MFPGRARRPGEILLLAVGLLLLPAHAGRAGASSRAVFGPYLGVLVAPPSRTLEISLALGSGDPGVEIVGLDAGSPAEAVRLQTGDLILAAGGEPTYSARDLDEILLRHGVGSPLTLVVRRGAETHEVSVRPVEPPPGDPGFDVTALVVLEGARTRAGVEPRPPESPRARLPRGVAPGDSLPVVTWVQEGVPGFASAGFKPGAVVLAVNGREVRSPGELRAVTRSLAIGEPVALRFARDGRLRSVRYRAQAPARPWAGARLEEMSALLVEAESLGTDAGMEGLFVRRVEARSAADRATLRPGDRILSLGGRRLGAVEDFDRAYAELGPGAITPIRVARRGGTVEELTLERAARIGVPRGERAGPRALSLEMHPGPGRPGTVGVSLLEWRGSARLETDGRALEVPLPYLWTKVTGPRIGAATSIYWSAAGGSGASVAADRTPGDRSAYARWSWDYGTGDRRWHHAVTVGGRSPWLPIVTYHDEPVPFHREEISNLVEASAGSALWGEDKLRYLRAVGWEAGWRLARGRFPAHEAEVTLELVRQSRLANVETSSLFGSDRFSPNPVAGVVEGRLHAATLRYAHSSLHRRTWARTLFEAEVRAAGGALGGDRDFLRWEGNLAPSFRLHRRLYLDSRLRAGLATGRLPLQESFYAGGKGTLPGYADLRFSGDRTVLARMRLSLVPFGLPEQAVQFRLTAGLDAGQAWRGAERAGIPSLARDLTFGAGLFVGGGDEWFFPRNVSVAWGRPLGDERDRAWRFQLEFFGGAMR